MSELKDIQPSANQEATEARIDQLERLARFNELVISGGPRLENENLDMICKNICDAVGFDGSNTIQSFFRVPFKTNQRSNQSSRQTSPSIIMKFWSSEAKEGFFKLYVTKKSLCVTNIGFSVPSRIYINDNLTKKNFEIYRLVRKLKADGKIFQYHTVSGRIAIKLKPDSRQIIIDSEQQLNSLIDDTAAQQQPDQRKNRYPRKRNQNQSQSQQDQKNDFSNNQRKSQSQQPNKQPNRN